MEIILLRHGKPDVELSGYLSLKQFKCLVIDYDQSGIQDTPIEKLKEDLNSHYIVCSNLLRSIDSAKKLGIKKINSIDVLFSEVSLPHFNKSFLVLPATVWLVLFRFMWLFGFNKNGESLRHAIKRSEQAAVKCISLAKVHERVVVIGHGVMNKLIERQLIKMNWQKRERINSGKYWGLVTYTL